MNVYIIALLIALPIGKAIAKDTSSHINEAFISKESPENSFSKLLFEIGVDLQDLVPDLEKGESVCLALPSISSADGLGFSSLSSLEEGEPVYLGIEPVNAILPLIDLEKQTSTDRLLALIAFPDLQPEKGIKAQLEKELALLRKELLEKERAFVQAEYNDLERIFEIMTEHLREKIGEDYHVFLNPKNRFQDGSGNYIDERGYYVYDTLGRHVSAQSIRENDQKILQERIGDSLKEKLDAIYKESCKYKKLKEAKERQLKLLCRQFRDF